MARKATLVWIASIPKTGSLCKKDGSSRHINKNIHIENGSLR